MEEFGILRIRLVVFRPNVGDVAQKGKEKSVTLFRRGCKSKASGHDAAREFCKANPRLWESVDNLIVEWAPYVEQTGARQYFK